MATTPGALRQLAEMQEAEQEDPGRVLSLDQNPMSPIQSVMGVLQLTKSKSASIPQPKDLSLSVA